MAGWRDRATKVEEGKTSWKDRATVVPSESQEPSTASDVLRGAEQGLTFSLSDELKGLGIGSRTAGSAIGGLKEAGKYVGYTPEAGDQDVAAYQKARDTARQEYKEAEERSPIAYNVGNIGGGVASSLVGGLGAVGLKGGALAAGELAALAGAEGGLMGTGASEAETAGELARDVGTSAAVSAVLPPVVSKLGGARTGGALLGGAAGYLTADEEDKLKGTLIGAGSGLAAGHAVEKLAPKVLESIPITQKFLRGREVGQEGTSIVTKEAQEGILEAERQAARQQASAIEEAKVLAQKEAQQARETLKKGLEQNISKNNLEVDKAKAELDRLTRDMLQSTKVEQQALGEAERRAAATKIRSEAADLSKKVNDIRIDAGKAMNSVYDDIAKSDMRVSTTDRLNDLKQKLVGALSGISEEDPSKARLSKLLDRLLPFEGEIPGDQFKMLQKILKEEGFEGGYKDRYIQSLLKEGYMGLNEQAMSDISSQGGQELADKLSKAKDTYSKIFAIEDRIGRFGQQGAAEKSVATVENLFKTKGSAKLGEKYQRFFDSLDKVSPELSNKVKNDLMILSEQYNKAGKTLSSRELDDAVQGKLRDLATQDPSIQSLVDKAGLPKQKFSKDLLEKSVSKELAEKQSAFRAMEELVGKQLPIEATGDIQPSSSLTKMFREELPQGEVTRRENYEKLLPKLIGEERSSELVKQAKKASKVAGLISDLPEPGLSSGLVEQTLGRPGTISAKLGNLVGLLEGKLKGANLAKALDKIVPENLKKMSSVIVDAAAGEGKSKYFSELLNNAAESTDPIRRRAILFTLQQDPGFRKLFGTEEE